VTCGKYLTTERLILGNPLVTEQGFHGYENGKFVNIQKPNTCFGINTQFLGNTVFIKSNNGILGGGAFYWDLSQFYMLKGSSFVH
jgi:hypothetical protein